MKNLDQLQKERNDIMQRMANAVREDNTENFTQAWNDLADAIQERVIGDVKEMQAQQDNSILAARGCRVLTSQEKQYYEKVIDAMRTDLPKQALTSINTVLPETVIDAVF